MQPIDAEMPLSQTSDKTDILFRALFSVQGQLLPIQVDSYNSHTKSNYASLAAIFKAIMPILQDAKLLLTHQMVNNADFTRIGVVQTLMEVESGQFVRDVYWLPVVNNHAQGHASAVTYLKRYLTSSRLGISFEDAAGDDDGNQAGRTIESAPVSPPRRQPESAPAEPAAATPAPPTSVKMTTWVHPLTKEPFEITALCLRQVERALNSDLTPQTAKKRLDVLESEAAKRFTGRDLQAIHAASAYRRQQFEGAGNTSNGVPVNFN